MKSVWSVIETAPATAAALNWQRWLGPSFNAVAALCLDPSQRPAERIFCDDGSGCNRRVRERGPRLVGVCACGEDCEDTALTKADVLVWELNLEALGRAIAKALGCRAMPSRVMGHPRTMQVAALGNPAVPVMLTVQPDQDHYRKAVAELIARLPKGFILLTPTKLVDEGTLGLLTRANLGFYDLESQLELIPGGKLRSAKSAEVLFAGHLPEKQAAFKESEVKKVFIILQKLKSKAPGVAAPLFDVFMAVVHGQMRYREAAKKCGCSLGTLNTRVHELETEFGMSIKQLQAYAGPLLDMETSVKGQRTAKKRQGAQQEEPEQYPETGGGENESGYLPEELNENE